MSASLLPLISGLALALIAGPLGCFVVWRRMAYFGDGLGHSALLGIALGILLDIMSELSILLVGLGFAFFLVVLRQRKLLAIDTLLGLLAHATLAFGIIAMALMGVGEVDMHDYLLGSLDGVTATSTGILIFGAVAGLALLIRIWPGLILMVTSEDLALAEGVHTKRYEALLMLLMAALVAVSIQLVGILLITSLLIIPAACARLFARTPEHMATLAGLIAAGSVTIGIALSSGYALDPGPVIVAVMISGFAGGLVFGQIARRS
jgi:zinc transport system permease protein